MLNHEILMTADEMYILFKLVFSLTGCWNVINNNMKGFNLHEGEREGQMVFHNENIKR